MSLNTTWPRKITKPIFDRVLDLKSNYYHLVISKYSTFALKLTAKVTLQDKNYKTNLMSPLQQSFCVLVPRVIMATQCLRIINDKDNYFVIIEDDT